MTEFEKLEQEAADNGIHIDYVDFKSERLKGLYCDGSIALSNALNTQVEKVSILSEELGHHYTSNGNIIDPANVMSRKQERLARLWAYNSRIGIPGLIAAWEQGCRNKYEISDYLEVSESMLADALECYRQKYGTSIWDGCYRIQFEPYFTIGKVIMIKD